MVILLFFSRCFNTDDDHDNDSLVDGNDDRSGVDFDADVDTDFNSNANTNNNVVNENTDE